MQHKSVQNIVSLSHQWSNGAGSTAVSTSQGACYGQAKTRRQMSSEPSKRIVALPGAVLLRSCQLDQVLTIRGCVHKVGQAEDVKQSTLQG